VPALWTKLISSTAVAALVVGGLTIAPAAAAADTPVLTIADIQGAGAASPVAGTTVSTTGVVTAAYPTGGLQGYTIQTPGTGGALDLTTHTASDGLFVFSAATVGAVAIGDYVRVTGPVSEFNGLTEITVRAADGLQLLSDPRPAVTPATAAWPGDPAGRESLESMLYQPTGDFTVTNTYATNQYGEVGLAAGTTPLVQPTDAAAPGSADAAAVAADNAARAVVLDDGASTNFLSAANSGQTPPYLSLTAPVRVGELATPESPVIVDYRNNTWKFNPPAQVTPAGTAAYPMSFKNDRTPRPDVQHIGAADLRVASFNVLNYFTTLGSSVAGCAAFKDRAGDPISVDQCPGNGPRGAWDADDLKRQQDKIVHAVNGLGADVVGLSEIENSAVLGGAPDAALSFLVDALNADAGAGSWAFVPSSTDLPPVAQMDVISNAIIYRPAAVTRTGDAHALGTQSGAGGAFENAREPIAQVFTPSGGDPFLFVMNHFKSKGSAGPWPGDVDSGDGQGASNESRVRQAAALRDWVPTVTGSATAVALVGDFNSNTAEQPLRVLYDAGYTDVGSKYQPTKYSYSFSGLSGSLDHILVNADALTRSTGADIWNINSGESVALQYSRYNVHGTLFYDDSVYASSDHDPVVLGLRSSGATKTIQVLGINDFHGRIQSNQVEAGAAVLSGAVHQLRTSYPNTVFAAAGDLIGASTFESFIARDQPTIDALNAAGLQVSAVGNHEFDQGYDDLVNRVIAGGSNATWQYLGANVRNTADGSPALPESWVQHFGTVRVGFVGAVTDHLPELVSPAGIAGLTIQAPVVAANREADKLKAAGADIVILLVHEGAATPALASATDPASDFGRIVTGVDENIDAIVSGHTHLSYNHSIPVQQWVDEGRKVTDRPVVSAGQYGYNLDQLLFTVDSTSGDVLGVQSNTLPLVTTTGTGSTATYTPNYPADPVVQAIVNKAVADAAVAGQQALGTITAPFTRAKLADGSTENRGGESTLGNLVAQVQRAATASATSGSAQIALMNPGGLRADLLGDPADPDYPKTVTYKQAATTQPFANTLVNMQLTGAQLRTVLEQQWQPAGATRPFLKLGISKGLTYTYDPAAAAGSHITGIWLDGTAIRPDAGYSVTVNSFLAAGGDNFTELANGTAKRDTGQTDLEAMVDYLAANDPVTPDAEQRAVGVSFPAGAPATYRGGDRVAFALSSLAFSAAADAKDTAVTVALGGRTLGTFPVDNAFGTSIVDEYGTAAVSVVLPAGTPAGQQELLVTGNVTGTTARVPLTVSAPAATVLLTTSPAGQVYGSSTRVTLTATVSVSGGGVPDGQLEFRAGDTLLGSRPLSGGIATYQLPANTQAGTLTVTARYPGTATIAGADSNPVTVTVEQARSTSVLVATRTDYRQGAFLPAILVGAVALNNGQVPRGRIDILRDGQVVGSAQVSFGLTLYLLPRSLPAGSYAFRTRFVPADAANIAGSDSNPVTIRIR